MSCRCVAHREWGVIHTDRVLTNRDVRRLKRKWVGWPGRFWLRYYRARKWLRERFAAPVGEEG